jgi:hypothetical protein
MISSDVEILLVDLTSPHGAKSIGAPSEGSIVATAYVRTSAPREPIPPALAAREPND